MEREKLFEVMRSQNYWYDTHRKQHNNYISRTDILNDALKTLDSKAITVIKGPRRSGKTVLLGLISENIIKNGNKPEQILYLNLEDYRIALDANLKILEEVLEIYRERINPEKKVYYMIDEIQNVEGFEHFLRTMQDMTERHDLKIKFIITGSNAKLLSKELGTLLTGRTVSINVFPFSYREYLEYHQKLPDIKSGYYSLEKNASIFKNCLEKYATNGGIPEFLEEKEPKKRINEYFENVIFRDIIERFSIRHSKEVHRLAIYLASNAASIYSVKNLSRIIGVSINTIQTYIEDLSLAYLFFSVDNFSASLKKRFTSQSKIYCIDTGILSSAGFKLTEYRGKIFENIVFIELLRRGCEIYYWRDSAAAKECDFIIKNNIDITMAIQVTTMLDEKVMKRELAGLKATMEKLNIKEGVILNDNIYRDIDNIKIRPLWWWLLLNN